eukprot:460903_1
MSAAVGSENQPLLSSLNSNSELEKGKWCTKSKLLLTICVSIIVVGFCGYFQQSSIALNKNLYDYAAIYSQWTGYTLLDDVNQLTAAEIRIRHIQGSYLYQSWIFDGNDIYYVHGRCALDSNIKQYSYWTLLQTTNDDYWYTGDTAYQFTNVRNGDKLTAVVDGQGDRVLYMSSGGGYRYFTDRDQSGSVQTVTLYGGSFPRYYTRLSVIADWTIAFQWLVYCPLMDGCWNIDEIDVSNGACQVGSTADNEDGLFTFEVNGEVDMSINNGNGPGYYYEGYGLLTDLRKANVVVAIRTISGAYLVADSSTDQVYPRCTYGGDAMLWILDEDSSGYYFLNVKKKTYLSYSDHYLSHTGSLNSNSYFSAPTFSFSDRYYTRLMIHDAICIDTSPADDQCDSTQRLEITKDCFDYTGGVIFEKVN